MIEPQKARVSPGFGNPEHAFVFGNASRSPIFQSYRKMRTQRLLDFGWRTADDLIDGLDHDRFDEIGAKTIHVVVTDAHHQPVGCSRISVIGAEEIRTSISPSMWGSVMDDMTIPQDVTSAAESGRLVDMNRLLNQPGAGFDEANVVIGAALAATKGRYGSLFTAGAALIRLVDVLGVPKLVLHAGRLGGRRAQLIYIPASAWGQVSDRSRKSVDLGKELVARFEGATPSIPQPVFV